MKPIKTNPNAAKIAQLEKAYPPRVKSGVAPLMTQAELSARLKQNQVRSGKK